MGAFTVDRYGSTFVADEHGWWRIPPSLDPIDVMDLPPGQRRVVLALVESNPEPPTGLPLFTTGRGTMERENEDDEVLREEDVTTADRLDERVEEGLPGDEDDD